MSATRSPHSSECRTCHGLLVQEWCYDYETTQRCEAMKCLTCGRVAQWGPVQGLAWATRR